MLFDKWGDARASDMELLCPTESLDCAASGMRPNIPVSDPIAAISNVGGERSEIIAAITDARNFLLFGRKHGTRHLGSAGRSQPTPDQRD
jgi:hypothetical protein